MLDFRLVRSLRSALIACSLFVACLEHVPAQQPAGKAPPYTAAQVLPVAVGPEVTISPEYVDGLSKRMVLALEDSKRFSTVTQSVDLTATPGAPTLRMASTVTRFVPGNRAERYLIGMGAGATKITVHLLFTDGTSSKVLLEKDVKGIIWWGAAFKGFGNPNSAQKDIAKDIRTIVVENF